MTNCKQNQDKKQNICMCFVFVANIWVHIPFLHFMTFLFYKKINVPVEKQYQISLSVVSILMGVVILFVALWISLQMIQYAIKYYKFTSDTNWFLVLFNCILGCILGFQIAICLTKSLIKFIFCSYLLVVFDAFF